MTTGRIRDGGGIFKGDRDRFHFKDLLAETVERFGLILYACLKVRAGLDQSSNSIAELLWKLEAFTLSDGLPAAGKHPGKPGCRRMGKAHWTRGAGGALL